MLGFVNLFQKWYTIFLTILQYKINRKMKILQKYWASTVIFIGIFSQCTGTLGIFATLVYVFTTRVVIYDLLSMAIIPTLFHTVL